VTVGSPADFMDVRAENPAENPRKRVVSSPQPPITDETKLNCIGVVDEPYILFFFVLVAVSGFCVSNSIRNPLNLTVRCGSTSRDPSRLGIKLVFVKIQ